MARSADHHTLEGRPTRYVAREFTAAQSRGLIDPDVITWADRVAGSPITDPHTGELVRVGRCSVRRHAPGEPAASFTLWHLGQRGFALAWGTTGALATDAATPWHSERIEVPIDGRSVRSAHLASAPPNTAPRTRRSPTLPEAPATRAADLVPPHLHASFGNLPAATQAHLLEPFDLNDDPPTDADKDTTTLTVDERYVERYVCYLRSSTWIAVAFAERSVLRSSVAEDVELWTRSPESRAIAAAPWRVAAWTCPVRPPSGRSAGAPLDPYAVLGVAATASDAEIRAARHELLQQHHPDVAGPGGHEHMVEINRAWEALRTPDVRAAADATLRAARRRASHGAASSASVRWPSSGTLGW